MALNSWLLRLTLLAVLVAVGLLLWSLSPLYLLLAAVVVLLPVLCLYLVLGMQFALLYLAMRRQCAKNGAIKTPAAGEMAKAWWQECACILKIFLWVQPLQWRREPDHIPARSNGRTGVVLIHGFLCNREVWNPWFGLLKARGHAFVAVNLKPLFGTIDAYVPLIDEAVKKVLLATGKPPILVCHSMGGLAARAWLRAGLKTPGAGKPRTRRVERVITIGSPHHGTMLAKLNPLEYPPNALEMQQESRWIKALQEDEAEYVSGAGESAGGGRYGRFTCYYSHCDNIVFPADAATLMGADNRRVPAKAHVAMALDPFVIAQCLELIAKA